MLDTDLDGTPILEVTTPKNTKRWRYRLGKDGPVKINGSNEAEPAWVKESARYWWNTVTSIHKGLAPNMDAARAFSDITEQAVKIAGGAIIHSTPDLRRQIAGMARDLQRRAHAVGTPVDVSQTALEASQRLSALLRRYNRNTRTQEGTGETVEKLAQDPVLIMITAGKLPSRAGEWAEQIRHCYNQVVAPGVQSQLGRMGEGGGAGYRGATPIDRTMYLSDDELLLQASFQRWRERMRDERPWWCDPKRIYVGSIVPFQSQSTASWWDVILATVIEQRSFKDADDLLNLPSGRAAFIMPLALTEFGGR